MFTPLRGLVQSRRAARRRLRTWPRSRPAAAERDGCSTTLRPIGCEGAKQASGSSRNEGHTGSKCKVAARGAAHGGARDGARFGRRR
eukprot:554906-Prymnesium_polylepis.1